MRFQKLISLVSLLLCIVAITTAQDCPETHDWEFNINATQGYQFFILEDNNITTNASSLAIPYIGFYVDGSCNPSNNTALIVIPFNNSVLVSTFYSAALQELCALFTVCNENDTCCSNGTLVFNVTDRPTCDQYNSTSLFYAYNTNSTYDLTPYFVVPTSPITFTDVIDPPTEGVYEISNLTFAYQQTGNFSTTDMFTVRICNQYGLCSDCPLNITAMRPPVCVNDEYTILYTTVVEFNPLLNDQYVDFSQNFTFTGLNITHFPNTTGTFTPTSNGTVIYAHGTNYTTSDMAIYTVCNDQNLLCDTCFIYLTINSGINCADDSFIVYSKIPSVLDILDNDFDLEYPDPTTWQVDILVQFQSGNATILPNNTLEFTSNYILGNDTLVYSITDPAGYNATCQAAVEVLWLPECGSTNFSINYNTNTMINVTLFDSNPAGPILNTTLGMYLYSNDTEMNGTVYATGLFVVGVNYLPPANYTGPDSFLYKLCDSTMSCINCTANVYVLPSSTTGIPTTAIPTTAVPTTAILTTTSITTASITTASTTTGSITTASSTTSNVTTSVPTTSVPTTRVPTTAIPTTSTPTTRSPTTAIPTSRTQTSTQQVSSSGAHNTRNMVIILVPVIVVGIGALLLFISLIIICMRTPKRSKYRRLETGRLPSDTEMASSKHRVNRVSKRRGSGSM